jgi:hypothetical protein
MGNTCSVVEGDAAIATKTETFAASPPEAKAEEQSEPSFPKHWGDPPEVQTSDPATHVEYAKDPNGRSYGRGPPEIADWIKQNMQSTEAKCKAATDGEEAEWQKKQEAVANWEVKEILRFLQCAGQTWGLDDPKDKLVADVRAVQKETIEKYLDMALGALDEQAVMGTWTKVVEEFLGPCLDSVNTRPCGRNFAFIHVAAQQGNADVLRQLTKLGADIFLTSRDGRTPKEVAKDSAQAAAVEFLESMEKRHSALSEMQRDRTAVAFQQCGKEMGHPRIFKRTKNVFEYKEDFHFSDFSRIAQEPGWDSCALSLDKGITKMTVRFVRRGTSTASGIADTRKRPCVFGLTEVDDLRPQAGLKQGVWVSTECQETENAQQSVAAKKIKEAGRLLSAVHDPLGVPKELNLELPDITPEDVIVIERDETDKSKITVSKGNIKGGSTQLLKEFINKGKKPWGDMHAKILMHDANDCVQVCCEPYAEMPSCIRHQINMMDDEHKMLLNVIIKKLLPDWLKEEIGAAEDGSQDKDPTDEKGHAMYVASLITMLCSRSWTKAEGQAMDNIVRSNYFIPYNNDWVDDLGKVLKRMWNNGGVPTLGNLRDAEHSKIPGSCKNKAVVALALMDVIRPKHLWKAHSVWRIRLMEEVEGRYPNKKGAPCEDLPRCQLHCVNSHAVSHRWFDVIRFWDRDPFHKWPLRYPDPELLNLPTPSNFDLTGHTTWLQECAAPGGKAGYGCPKRVPGTVPWKLYVLGVEGDKIGPKPGEGNAEEEEEEEDSDDPH